MPRVSVMDDELMRPSRPQRAALAALRAYKILISPYFAGSCRYVPSCSEYAADAIANFGLLKGSALAVRRLMRCHPFGGHGLDMVPPRKRQL